MAQLIEILGLPERGRRLRKLRELGEMSQGRLGDLLGYKEGAPTISRIENGHKRLPEDRRKIAANVLAGQGELVSNALILDAYLDGREHDLRECIAPPGTDGGARNSTEAVQSAPHSDAALATAA